MYDQKQVLPHYQGKITINPKENLLESEITLTYDVKNGVSKLSILLHKDTVIETIESKYMKDYVIEDNLSNDIPFVLEAKRIIIHFDRPLHDMNLSVLFRYTQTLSIVTKYTVNRISETFIELGLYTPWYPLLTDMQEATFDIRLDVPNDYTVVNGYHLSKKENIWRIKQTIPNVDCSFLAFKDVRVIGCDAVKIYCLEQQVDIARNLFSVVDELFSFYQDIFGKTTMDKHLSIALVPREIGGGYGRHGLIVLNLVEDNVDKHFAFIAHEMAHLWWNKANVNSFEDWLNESFAEMSSLMALRTYKSDELYKDILDKYNEKSKDTPAIMNISRSDEKAVQVLYMKGPLLLFRLENLLGKDRFKTLLRKTHESSIKDTTSFIELIADLYSEDDAKTFKNWLKTE